MEAQKPVLTSEYVRQLIVQQIKRQKKKRKLLFLWADWCKACESQMEVLEKLVQACQCGDLLEVETKVVSTDPYKGLTEEGKRLYKQYHCPEGVPCIVILDPSGRHVKTIDSLREDNIKKHLADVFEVVSPLINPIEAEKSLERRSFRDRAYKGR